jgi:alpha-L-fucosidase
VDTVSRGGNLLLDIGARANGTIRLIMEQRLKENGDWLKVNGERGQRTHTQSSAAVLLGGLAQMDPWFCEIRNHRETLMSFTVTSKRYERAALRLKRPL